MKKLCFIFLSLFSVLFADDAPADTRSFPFQEEATPLPPDHFEKTFKNMLWALFAIIILIFLTVWMFRKVMKNRIEQTNRVSDVKILEKRPLSPKTMLYVVEMDGEKALISESHLEVRKLD